MSIGKNTSYLVAANIIRLATSLALGLLTARLLGPAGKGEMYLVLQIGTMGGLVLALGLGHSYQYHLTKGLMDRGIVISHLLVYTGLASLLIAGGYLLWGRTLTVIAGATLSPPLVLLAYVAIPINLLVVFATPVLMSQPGGIGASSLLNTAAAVLTVGFVAVFVALLKWGPVGAIAAYLLVLAAQGVVTLYMGARHSWRRLRLPVGISTPLLGFGLSLFLGNLAVTSVFRIDIFLLSSMRGAAALGIYSVAVAFAELVLMVPNALGTSLFALLPGVADEERRAVMMQASRVTLVIAVIIGLLTAAFAYPLVVVLMGDRFRGSVLPLALLVPGLVAMSLNYVYANYFAAGGRPLVNAAYFGIGLVLNVLLNLMLIPSFGVPGCALASTGAYFAVTAAYFVRLRSVERVPMRPLLLSSRAEMTRLLGRMLHRLPFAARPAAAAANAMPGS